MKRPVLGLLCVAFVGCAGAKREAPPATTTGDVHTAAVSSELPVVVVVRADWCPACHRIAPAVAALQREYAGRVSFVILDVTDDATSARSRAAAERAGVGEFFRANDATGVVAVFTKRRVEVATLAGEADVSRYRAPLATALAAN